MALKRILTINSGSSSIKFSLYRIGGKEELLFSGRLERIGLKGGSFFAADSSGKTLIKKRFDMPGHDSALLRLFSWLEGLNAAFDAVGHRVVHGGDKFGEPGFIDSRMLRTLDKLLPFVPEHLPHEIKAIEAVRKNFPKIPQAACFDTSFHRDKPLVARMYPLPRRYYREGIVRYGFHGLSYEYIMEELKKEKKDRGRVVIAHLGNGASMAAVKDGKGVDTTMGFTPTGGLMMSSRSGDLDPGVILYLLKEKGLSPDELNLLLNKRSGLRGVSGLSSDMEDIIGKYSRDRRAKEAFDLFCYLARKHLASLVSVLGGLDTLVFTGGIGENSPRVRRAICSGMKFMGISLDKRKNERNGAVISQGEKPVEVLVMKTNEELVIARHTAALLAKK